MAELMDYLTQAVERRASDLFFVAGGSASAKIEGQILPLDGERLLPPRRRSCCGPSISWPGGTWTAFWPGGTTTSPSPSGDWPGSG